VGLGEVGVEREQDSGDAEGEGVVEDLSECGGGDVEGGVLHVPDHDGVDDAHEHPAELGCDQGQREGEDGSDLAPDRHCTLPPPVLCKVFQTRSLGLDFDEVQVSWNAKTKAPFGGAFIVGVSIIGVQVEMVGRM
jgi:hypothetical protein